MNKQIFAGATALVAAVVLSACGGGQSGDSLSAQDHSESVKSAAPGTIAQDNTNRISSNGSFVVAVDNKGAVYSWGDNSQSQLYGTTTASNATMPMLVPTLSGIQSVKAGVNHAVALTADGRVVTWGNSTGAVLGTGRPGMASGAVQVASMSGIKAIAAGNGHTEALHTNGNVWGWGTIGNLNAQVAPQLISGLSSMKAISGAGNFLVALRNDGTLWGVGSNSNGQLGTGIAHGAYATSPVQIVGIANVQSIAVGANHVLAMTADGSVYAWGSNAAGQLAQPLTTSYNATPQKITNLKATASIFAGDNNSGAVYTSGKVVAWGNGATGALGDGKVETGSVIAPAAIVATQLGVGAGFGANSVYLIQQDGTVISSGSNAQGQLGSGNYASHYTPVNVLGVNGIAQLRLGISQ
jgi:alpha-tubulin suppressor-like RCC1 family protein